LKVLTEVANVSNLRIHLPDPFFSSRSFYSVSTKWYLILNALLEVKLITHGFSGKAVFATSATTQVGRGWDHSQVSRYDLR